MAFQLLSLTSLPLCTFGSVVGKVIVVHSLLTLPHESFLLSISTNAGSTHECLLEVRIDWRV